MADLHVVLVHGTFAKDAPWTAEDGDFQRELQHRFGERIEISRFSWSAGNTVWARMKATMELVEHIDLQHARSPNAKLYVISHSHAGNVAVKAASHTRIDGIACLSTPFIHTSFRDKDLFDVKSIYRGIIGILWFSYFLAGSIFDFSFQTYVTSAVVFTVVSIVLAGFTKSFIDFSFRNTEKLIAYTELHPPSTTRLFILRGLGDEASLGLSFGQLLSWLSLRSYAVLTRKSEVSFLKQPFRKIRLPVFAYLFPFVFMALLLTTEFIGKNKLDFNAISPAIKIGIIMPFLLLAWIKTSLFDIFLVRIASAGIMLTSAVAMLSIGTIPPRGMGGPVMRLIVGWSFATVLNFYTEDAPIGGPWTIQNFDVVPILEKDENIKLIHSLYEHPRVRHAVSDWLERNVMEQTYSF